MTIPDKNIQRDQSDGTGRNSHTADGHMAALTCSRPGTARIIIIDHTEVPDAFRGQGVGLAPVARAVADARAEGVKITPLCPFAAAQFRRHPDWHDVLDR